MREIMDSGKISVVNLSKGKMGEDNSALLGAMIISRLQLAAMSRVDIPEEKRRDFYPVRRSVPELCNRLVREYSFRSSQVPSLGQLAHQYIGQLVTNEGNTKVRDSVFGNVGTIVTFRVGAADGEFLETEFLPEIFQKDLVNLAKDNIYLKLMIDGVSSKPFSATTLPPHIQPLQSYKDIIIKNTRTHYAVPRAIVDEPVADEWNGQSDTINEKSLGGATEAASRRFCVPRRHAWMSRVVMRPRSDAGARDRCYSTKRISRRARRRPRQHQRPRLCRRDRYQKHPESTPITAVDQKTPQAGVSAPASHHF